MSQGQRDRVAEAARRAGAGRWAAAAAAALAVLFGVGIYAWRSGVDPAQLAALGYPGIFLVMFINGSSIVIPVPGQAAVLAGGALWNPLLVGISAGLGNATGELTSYLIGRAARALLDDRTPPRWWRRLREWLTYRAFVTILAIAAVPNPIFHAVSIISGSLGYPARRFWLACAIGNSIKYSAMAYISSAAINGFW